MRILGLVIEYQSSPDLLAQNIERYIDGIDRWNNIKSYFRGWRDGRQIPLPPK